VSRRYVSVAKETSLEQFWGLIGRIDAHLQIRIVVFLFPLNETCISTHGAGNLHVAMLHIFTQAQNGETDHWWAFDVFALAIVV